MLAPSQKDTKWHQQRGLDVFLQVLSSSSSASSSSSSLPWRSKNNKCNQKAMDHRRTFSCPSVVSGGCSSSPMLVHPLASACCAQIPCQVCCLLCDILFPTFRFAPLSLFTGPPTSLWNRLGNNSGITGSTNEHSNKNNASKTLPPEATEATATTTQKQRKAQQQRL